MYTLGIKYGDQPTMWFVASRKKLIFEELAKHGHVHWRSHDGNGWWDGSPDAWQFVGTALPQTAIILRGY